LKSDAGWSRRRLELGEVRRRPRVRAGWAAEDARIIQNDIGQEEVA
jgi:hypothetical protein